MQITELMRLTRWFKQKVIEKKIPNFYQNLFNKMNQNAVASINQPKQPFEDDRNNLFDSLRELNLNSLTLEQVGFLEKLEIIDLLGEEGVENIEDVLYENNLDIATAAKKIGEFDNKIKNAVTTINEIDDTLSKSFTIGEEEELPDDFVMMRVYFQEGVSINNISDFKKLGATWHEIGRGIAMAQDKTPQDFKIIGAQKGSLIIEMALIAGIATSVSTILLQGLKVAERVIDLLKKAEELRAMKLSNKKIEQDIKKEAETEKENGIQSILDYSVEQLGLKPQQNGDKVSALKKSVTKLIEFIEKGGAVDFIEPDDELDDEENEKNNGNHVRSELRKLKSNVQEIRELENKLKILEAKIDNE